MKTVLVATDVRTICSTESYLKIWPECECVCIKSVSGDTSKSSSFSVDRAGNQTSDLLAWFKSDEGKAELKKTAAIPLEEQSEQKPVREPDEYGSIDSVRLLFVKAESVEFVNVGDKPAWRVWYLFELPCFIRKFLSCRLRLSLSGGDRGKFVIISKIIFPLTRGQQ